MNELKEKLKKIGSKLAAVGSWVGNHLGACLTIFSVAIGFLFLRERNKRLSAETDLELDQKQDAVNAAKQEVENAQQQADQDYEYFNDLCSRYAAGLGPGKRKPKRKPAKSGSKKRAAKRKA